MNRLLLLSMLLLGLVSCKYEVSVPVSSCTSEFLAETAVNPKAAAYQAALDKFVTGINPGVPGVSVLLRSPDETWTGASGLASIETGEAMLPCHLHHSASVCKIFIATSIMILYERGKLDLDDPIQKYLTLDITEGVSNADVATVRQLLNHTSGIFNFDSNLKVFIDSYNTFYQNKSSMDMLEKYVYGVDAYFPVGEGFHYSNTNYLLLGMIIENAGSMSLGDFVQENILDVAGMNDTYYKSTPGYPSPEGMVNSYFEHFEGQLQNCTDIQTHLIDIAMGYEGIIAPVADYARFIEALFSGKFVSEALVQAMMVSDDESNYGLGLMHYKTDYGDGYGHTGGGFGTATYVVYFPEKQSTFVMCSNIGAVFYGASADHFYDDMYNAVAKEFFTGK